MVNIVDMHCHILPEVDDGSKNLQMSRDILIREYEQGVRRIIFTPHYRERMFETERRELILQYYRVREMVRDLNMNMHLHLGCECHYHEQMAEHLDAGYCLTMAQSRYVLVEFSSADGYIKIRNAVYGLVNRGYIPIIAHVERYPCIVRMPEYAESLFELGVRMQLNADSVLGMEGREKKKFCHRMLTHELVHYIGSDVHNISNRDSHIGKCASYVERKYGHEYAERIFHENPMKIIKRK